ncbi:DUF1120 domain-containing protein [Herbaspirillum robiniae]|uniref:DUF1120 domain-containing protein n=1 Tax=Herbaspirillum robiniae TaxID=2014887 RepID=UPI003D781CE3
MRLLARLFLLSASLLASSAVNAAGPTTELKVAGTIKPSACVPSFSGSNVIDYGTIASASLNQSSPTKMMEKTVPFSITCDSSMRFFIRSVDNRNSSVVSGLVASLYPIYGENVARGLGSISGKKIGVYSLRLLAPFTADGKAASIIGSNGGGNWQEISGGAAMTTDDSWRHSFSTPGMTAPTAFKTISGVLAVHVVIDKAANLPLNQEVPLDGSSTIEITYL